ncbi:MAG: DMT family transporter [Reinekea sp.]|nr:DMT family transporter [Reinekea sp.]
MTNERKALLFALTAVLLWSTVATAFKVALQYHSVLSLLTGASLTSLITFSVVLLAKGRFRPSVRALPGNWKNALLLGAVNPVIYYLVLFAAYDRLPAQVAQPVNYTWAITLALLSVPILKHRLNRFDIIGLLLGYAGVTVISLAGKNVTGELDLFGLFLALLSTFLWAGFWLLNTRNALDPLTSLFHNFLIATPILLVALIWTDSAPALSWPAVTSVAYVGLFEMGITFIFWQQALRLTNNAARIGTLIFLSPFISLFLISLVLKEPLQLQTFFGLGLIIAGVWLSQRRSASTLD